MVHDDAARNKLYNLLSEQMGQEATSALMSFLPPDGWPELATRDDVRTLGAELRAEMHTELGAVRGEIAVLRGEFGDLRAEFGLLRGELRSELHTELGAVRGEMAELSLQLTSAMRLQLLAIIGVIATMQGLTIAVLSP